MGKLRERGNKCPVCDNILKKEIYPKISILFSLSENKTKLFLDFLFSGACPLCDYSIKEEMQKKLPVNV